MLEGLRKPTKLIVSVVTLLAYGCPVQAIVKAFGLDERTVAAWRDRAGAQCQRVQEAVIQSGKLSLTHVQIDEIRVKTRSGVIGRRVSVQFLVVDAGIKRCHEANGAWIYRSHVGS